MNNSMLSKYVFYAVDALLIVLMIAFALLVVGLTAWGVFELVMHLKERWEELND